MENTKSENIVLDEGTSISISLNATDIELDNLTYSIEGGSESTVNAVISESIIEFFAIGDFYGSEDFTASVSDGSLSASQTFTVTVMPVNDIPEFTEDTLFETIDEDQVLVVDISSYVFPP